MQSDNPTELEKIGIEMAKQDNRMTQYPMFVVYHIVERAVPDDQGESRRKDSDYWDSSMLCEECLEKEEANENLPDYCENCDPECFWNCEESLEPDLTPGVFFTAKACQQHIDENHYHYNKPVVYGIGSWRNEEMQLVQKHLIALAGEEIPSHYK